MSKKRSPPCTLLHLTDTQASLLADAVDTATDRDRWRREARHLEAGCDDPHCGLHWRIWQAKATTLQTRAEAAEAALVEIIRSPATAGPAIAAWRAGHGPDSIANTPTPAPWNTKEHRP